MEDYLNGINEDLWCCLTGGDYRPGRLEQVGTASSCTDVVLQANKQKANDKKCLCELRGALQLVVYNYVRGCKTTKEIWDILKEKYQGSEKTRKSSVKQCLLELGEFKQKENETIEL
ncbi:hypothetical protein Lser_V15G11539 [Lactuca serriola]